MSRFLTSCSCQISATQTPHTMYIVTVSFEIKAKHQTEFNQLMRDNAKASVDNEPGCLQFDICSNAASDKQVFLYEVYTSREAFEEHLQSAHFIDFNAATTHMVSNKTVESFSCLVAHNKLASQP